MAKIKKTDAQKKLDALVKEMNRLVDRHPQCGGVATAFGNDEDGEYCRAVGFGGAPAVALSFLYYIAGAAKIVEREYGEFPPLLYDEIVAALRGSEPRNILPAIEASLGSADWKVLYEEDEDSGEFLPRDAEKVADRMAELAEDEPGLNFMGVVFDYDSEARETIANCDAAHAVDAMVALAAEVGAADIWDFYEELYDELPELIRDALHDEDLPSLVEDIVDEMFAGEGGLIDRLLEEFPLFEDVDDAIDQLRHLSDLIVDTFPGTHIVTGVSYATEEDNALFNLIFDSTLEESTFIILAIINQYYLKMKEMKDPEEFMAFRSVFPHLVERICRGETLEKILTAPDEPEPRNRAERRRMKRNRRG